jgi:Golgi phosphoprotein 3 (GPP34)
VSIRARWAVPREWTGTEDSSRASPAAAWPTVPASARVSPGRAPDRAELDLIGAIAREGKHVRATGADPQSDFRHQLELIRDKPRPHTPKRWVSMLESRAELHRVYEGMASLGIVDHVGEKHLGLFRTTRYPEKDHAPEAALLQKIEAALTAGPPDAAPADPRTSALIALLSAAGLLEKLFPAADEGRARDLAQQHWPSRALADELRMIRLAEAEAAT